MSRSSPRGHASSASLLLALSAFALPAAHAFVVDFGDVTLPGPGTYANGGPVTNNTGFTSGGVHFSNDYFSGYDSWYGFAVSSTTDATTPGYSNQYSAIAGGGFGDSQYAVAYGSAYGDPTVITLGAPLAPQSVRLTNTTYAGLDVLDGNPPFSKKFGGVSGNDPDYFTVTLTGRDVANGVTGAVEFFLADYRFADNSLDYVVNTWSLVDLTPLGSNVKTITFSFSSSDIGVYGINTPTYAALDALTVIPEPATFGGLAGAVGLVFAGWRRRRMPLRAASARS